MRGMRTVVISCLCNIVFFGGTDGGKYPAWVEETLDEFDEMAAEFGVKLPPRPEPLLPGPVQPETPRPVQPETPRPVQPETPRPHPEERFGQSPPTPQPPPQATATTQPPITFIEETLTREPKCRRSISWRNGKRVECQGDEIFKDDFRGTRISKNNWFREIYMPEDGFMVLQEEQAEIVDGKLRITPKLNPNSQVFGRIHLEKCTKASGPRRTRNPECFRGCRHAFITPPVSSARLFTHNTSFKYGIIEIRAKLPVGDWIVPHIVLDSKIRKYGSKDFDSGRIVLVKSRGNRILKDKNSDKAKDISNKALESLVHIKDRARPMKTKHYSDGWGENFHVYKLIWTADSLAFYVDDEEIGKDVVSNLSPYYKQMGLTEREADEYLQSSTADPMAPFDEEFYLSVGVDVGGMDAYDFPDDCINGNRKNPKPWKSTDSLPFYEFWSNRRKWKQTWTGTETLEIDYIKITAL